MFAGSCVALVTPMKSNGEVDDKALNDLVEWHIGEGTAAIVISGTTGESPTLTTDEQAHILKCALQTAKKRIPIIAGTGTNATASTIKKTQMAKELGADGCLIVTPYYNRPTQAGLIQHFNAVANQVDMPILLYNVPSRTGCDLQPETVANLSQSKNIIGIKEATGNLERLKALQAQCPKDFLFYSGDDPTACEFMMLGGHGVISVTSNAAPRAMQAMCELALNQEREKATSLDQTLQSLHKLCIIEANPIPIKWAMHYLGKIENGIRLPLTVLASQYHEKMIQALKMAAVN
ncbi:4-hydroxy-tetrahydrodipicolinate synthase [Candidatus Berkiella aquae]|uniref:4-hydroxy-tetrahydrodipicolinate synthase n=1 Tax=Candidatus Berkiella aquae TaxID=295108 RepID=A0A0Q9YNF9_9GAMM|nr:4-hydroxy-tetrahydrodipicolinate synthase [Candidatus Berkiella aquae]MCS5712466.1 4-hydroxy-tetrahydrodipicolinate synthase [Candidatus Berkiella aquae]